MVEEKTKPPSPKHVFEERTGRRPKRIIAILVLVFLVTAGFATEFIFRVYTLSLPTSAASVFQEQSENIAGIAPESDVISIVMKDSAYTDCGQGLFDFGNEATGIAGYVPYNDAVALAALRAHCNDLDTVYYQAFSFDAAEGTISALGENGAFFPLPEFSSGFRSRKRPIAFPILTPIIGTATESLEGIFNKSASGGVFQKQLEALDLSEVDGGFCLDLSAYPDMQVEPLLSAFELIDNWLNPKGLQSCIIGNIDSAFWSYKELVDMVDKTVLLGFQKTNSPATPVAMQSWFDIAATAAKEIIPPAKSSFALGSFATVWKSGERSPERIPFSESMLRAQAFEGTVSFSAETGNTHIQYLDDERRLNQVWVLDAVSFHNQRTALVDGSQTTIWPLGYEDPAVWALAVSDSPVETYKAVIETSIDISDHVAVEGTGPFSTHIAHAVLGHRQITTSAESERIVGQTYSQIPSPQRIRFFGDAGNLDISVTFNGLGSARETEILLTLLEQYSIKATFFLSPSDLLLSESLVRTIVSAGHIVGASTFPRESQSILSELVSTVQNNLRQQIFQDKFGFHTILVENPSRYGQFPGDKAILNQLQHLQTSGFLPVYRNLAAPYGEFDPLPFVKNVRRTAFFEPASVLGFDFSAGNDATLNLILPEVLKNLVDNGFTFTTLPEIAGLQVEQVLPASGTVPDYRNRVIYWFMTVTWIGVQNFIFFLALIVALRAPVYLVLAFLRRNNFPIEHNYHPPVTVIIPAYNEERVIERTLKSVLDSDYPNLKVIVADDGSTDRTPDIVASRAKVDDRITLIRQSNHGKWFAEDTALRIVETPFFVIVDADTLLHRDAIRYLVQPFRDGTVGAVGGTVEIGNRDNFITSCQVVEYKISLQVMHRAQEVFNGILVVPGAIGAWRTQAVIESGYVSGDTITEDADLTLAVLRSGYKVKYAPEAKSYTEAPNSISSFMQQRLRWSLGMLQVSWKHKKSIREGYAVGYISIADEMWYRLVSNVVYPLVDLIMLYTVISWGYTAVTTGVLFVDGFSVKVIIMLFLLSLMDVTNLVAAFWFDKKFEWKLLFLVPIMRFGYRQLLYISSIRAFNHAVSGKISGWHKLKRTNTAVIRD